MQHSEFSHKTMLISAEVCSLLRVHDCVIVPGFGGFVAGYAPATVHPVTHIFQPPHKHVLFNRNLQTDDGLLISRIQQHLKTHYAEARNWLLEYSSVLHERLQAGERVELGELGYFSSDIERNLLFRQQLQLNLLSEAYGLSAIQAAPIQRVQPTERKMPEAEVEAPKPLRKSNRRFYLPAAAATLLAAAWFLIPGNTSVQQQTLELFPSPTVSLSAKRIEGYNASAHTVRKALSFESAKSDNFSAETARIFLVAGCYSTQSNADGMVQYLIEKGFDARILDRTPAGLFRVVYDSYPDVQSASAELDAIRKGLNEEAWMLIR